MFKQKGEASKGKLSQKLTQKIETGQCPTGIHRLLDVAVRRIDTKMYAPKNLLPVAKTRHALHQAGIG